MHLLSYRSICQFAAHIEDPVPKTVDPGALLLNMERIAEQGASSRTLSMPLDTFWPGEQGQNYTLSGLRLCHRHLISLCRRTEAWHIILLLKFTCRVPLPGQHVWMCLRRGQQSCICHGDIPPLEPWGFFFTPLLISRYREGGSEEDCTVLKKLAICIIQKRLVGGIARLVMQWESVWTGLYYTDINQSTMLTPL